MALIVMCSRCGFELQRVEAEDTSLSAKKSLLTDVSRRYGSKCPNCSKLLSLRPELVDVRPAGSPLPKPGLIKVRPLKLVKPTRILPLTKFS